MEEKIYFSILFFLIVFVLIYFVTYVINYRKYKKKKYQSIGEYHYLILKFHLDPKKLNVGKMIFYFSIFDALIIAFVTTFITSINVSIMWQMLIGFVFLFLLIYAVYELYGRHLVKKMKKEKGMNDYEL